MSRLFNDARLEAFRYFRRRNPFDCRAIGGKRLEIDLVSVDALHRQTTALGTLGTLGTVSSAG